MENNNKATTAVITMVIGALLGGGIGYASGNSRGKESAKSDSTTSMSQSSPNTNTKSAGLRALLNNLEAEHVDLASTATRAGFDGASSFAAAADSLGRNTDNLAAAIGSVYGAEAGAKFKQIWASHIGFFVDYTVAAKKGDKAGMDKAVQNLNGYVEAISSFLSGANPNLPKGAVAQLVTEHVGLLKEAVDTYGAGNFAGSFDAQSRARTQITTKIADTLAGAIVKQSPDKF